MHVREFHPDADESVLYLHGGNVAGWMWDAQVAALPGFHALVPDLPGFGASKVEGWTDPAGVADQLAEVIRTRAHGGRAHVVGLSLGAVLGVVLASRHPALVRSLLTSGAVLRGVRGFARFSGLAQLRLWGVEGYWRGLAAAYRMPADSVEIFVRTGLGIDRASARRMMGDVLGGVDPAVLEGLRALEAPVLAVAGQLESRMVRDALAEVAVRAPHTVTRLAPRMHHVWSAEDPELFHLMLRDWLDHGRPNSALLPA